MKEFLNQLDKRLMFKRVNIVDDTYHIHCEMTKKEGLSINTRKVRQVKDINFGDYKVVLHITTRKYFPTDDNPHYTSDDLPFLNYSKRRTQRLDDYCLKIIANQSFIGSERFLKDSVGYISDSTLIYLTSKKKLSK